VTIAGWRTEKWIRDLQISQQCCQLDGDGPSGQKVTRVPYWLTGTSTTLTCTGNMQGIMPAPSCGPLCDAVAGFHGLIYVLQRHLAWCTKQTYVKADVTAYIRIKDLQNTSLQRDLQSSTWVTCVHVLVHFTRAYKNWH
jgi:hypothetical protein